MKSKTILFAINTEFALMIGLLYYEFYKKDTHNAIWLFLYTSDNRFKNIDINAIPGEVHFYKENLNYIKSKSNTSFLKVLKGKRIHDLVHQNNYKVSILLIKSIIKNKELKEIFIADGIGLNVRRSTYFMIRQNVILNYRRVFSGLLKLPIYTKSAKEYIKTIDLYINSEILNNISTAFMPFSELLLKSKNSEVIQNVFKSDFKDEYDIYFFTQPILKQDFPNETKTKYEEVLKVIVDFANQHNKKLLIKVHPRESIEQYSVFASSFCSVYANNNIPAEILFNIIKYKKIISCFSSISTLDIFNLNSHFWFYPLVNYYPKFSSDTSTITIIKDNKSLINHLK